MKTLTEASLPAADDNPRDRAAIKRTAANEENAAYLKVTLRLMPFFADRVHLRVHRSNQCGLRQAPHAERPWI